MPTPGCAEIEVFAMPLDPQVEKLLETLKAAGLPDITKMTPEEARQVTRERQQARRTFWSHVGKRQEGTVPGPGGPIPIRVYTPSQGGTMPGLIYFHGGGFVLGDLDSCDQTCKALSDGAGCVVVSVDYRLAPENKFPAGPEDCLAATEWVAVNARQLQIDPRRIGVGGESAGGTLAAVVALAARDRGGPRLAFQLLIYPCTDATMRAPSHQENGEGYMLTRDRMAWFWEQYLDTDDDRTNPFISPLHAKNLQRLPPAVVLTAEFDPLRDEGEAYANRLDNAGVSVICQRYPGMIHGFIGMADSLDVGRRALAQLMGKIQAGFSDYAL
jgi:acetyl esterase